MIEKISVIGLGKLGGSMAASFASRGFDVIGVDLDQNVVQAFNEGRAPVQETGLDEMIIGNRERISATLNTEEAVINSNISFVIVPTPSDERGGFSLEFAKRAFKSLGQALRKKDDYHVIVMTSTVLPGSCRYGLIPILEMQSGKKCGVDFGFCYNPEFIALGSVIRDFLNPDFYLLGQYDERSGNILEFVHNSVALNNAPVKRMTLENAELSKVAVNSFVTLKISFANMLAEFSEKLPNGDVDVISDALGMDRRIGRHYLTGGLGFAGPCFPRDNVALDFLGRMLDVNSELLRSNHTYNESLIERYFNSLQPYLPAGAKVVVLGLAYKPLSHVIDESPGLKFCQILAERGYPVVAHDALAVSNAMAVLSQKVQLTESLDEALVDADVIIVATTDSVYLELTPARLKNRKKMVTLIDFWRKFRQFADEPGIRYVPIGMSRDAGSLEKKLVSIWKEMS